MVVLTFDRELDQLDVTALTLFMTVYEVQVERGSAANTVVLTGDPEKVVQGCEAFYGRDWALMLQVLGGEDEGRSRTR